MKLIYELDSKNRAAFEDASGKDERILRGSSLYRSPSFIDNLQ